MPCINLVNEGEAVTRTGINPSNSRSLQSSWERTIIGKRDDVSDGVNAIRKNKAVTGEKLLYSITS